MQLNIDGLKFVLFKYFRKRVEAEKCGVNEFARRSGIVQSDTVNTFNGKRGVSLEQLTKISETIGPPLHLMLAEIAGMCASTEIQTAYEVESPTARVSVKKEDAKLLDFVPRKTRIKAPVAGETPSSTQKQSGRKNPRQSPRKP